MAVGFEETSISQQRVVWPGSQGGKKPTLSEKNVVLRTILPSKVTRKAVSQSPFPLPLASAARQLMNSQTRGRPSPSAFSLTTPQDTPSSQLAITSPKSIQLLWARSHRVTGMRHGSGTESVILEFPLRRHSGALSRKALPG